MASDKDADRWRKLLDSPFDDTTPHRPLWPWVAGAAGVGHTIRQVQVEFGHRPGIAQVNMHVGQARHEIGAPAIDDDRTVGHVYLACGADPNDSIGRNQHRLVGHCDVGGHGY